VPYPNLKSEYQKKFKPFPFDDNRYRAPERKPFHGPAYKPAPAKYPAHPPQQRQQKLQEAPLRPLPFDGTTTYKDNFIPREIDPKDPKKPQEAKPSLPFTGNTEYRKAFDGKEGAPAEPVRPLNKPAESGPFNGSTEHRDQYQGRPGPLEKPTKEPFQYDYGPPRDLQSSKDMFPRHKGVLCPARLLKHKKPHEDCHMHFHFSGQFNELGDPLYVA